MASPVAARAVLNPASPLHPPLIPVSADTTTQDSLTARPNLAAAYAGCQARPVQCTGEPTVFSPPLLRTHTWPMHCPAEHRGQLTSSVRRGWRAGGRRSGSAYCGARPTSAAQTSPQEEVAPSGLLGGWCRTYGTSSRSSTHGARTIGRYRCRDR